MAILKSRGLVNRPAQLQSVRVESRANGLMAVCFSAMASPCEVLLPSMDNAEATTIGLLAAQETWRIEARFSRYRSDSVIAWLHANRGKRVVLDEETAGLMDFAERCYILSGGLFDITSGILRQAWRFDGSNCIPDSADLAPLLLLIGFDKLDWDPPCLTLPAGMELDFGGIGKEYAVDRVYDLLARSCSHPFLVNLGGDLRANRPPLGGSWQIGIENADASRDAALLLDLQHGALATSGDSHRFIMHEGIRYGHIMDPRTGWPIRHAPRSVTVSASSCTEAGLLSTLAYLQGEKAESFLIDQEVKYWILR
jgi:FAD:protein FMN transferase